MLNLVFYILIGLILLTLSGNFLVKGAVSIAGYYRISTLVIGATVVSMGTSAPELIVSIEAALANKPEIALGNVIGSNISNIALVLGMTALILPIPVRRSGVKWDWSVMVLSAIFLFVALTTGNQLSRFEGALFTVGLIAYVTFTIYRSRKSSAKNKQEIIEDRFWFRYKEFISLFKTDNKTVPLFLAIVSVVVASIGLVYGAKYLVVGASGLAARFGVSERVIAVSVIAFGTSVPELATSIVAAIKKEMDISIGNIIGSNIFNIFGILGITSLIKPVSPKLPAVDFSNIQGDIIWMLAISVLLIFLMIPFAGKLKIKGKFASIGHFLKTDLVTGGRISRIEGLLLLSLYFIYIFWVFF